MRPGSASLRSVASLLLLAVLPAGSIAGPTVWAQFPLGPFPVNTPTTVALGAGSSVDVTVATGGTQGVNGAELDTLGVAETGLQYQQLRCLAIFNGGGSGSVPTSLRFTNIQVGDSHLRGLLMVGAINGLSSPVTATSTVAGRVQAWTVVGHPFDFGPTNSFPVSWNAGAGTITTDALAGNDSRSIVLDLGDLATDGDLAVTLNQHLNDGIIYSIGEERTAEVGVLIGSAANGFALGAPYPNPARDEASVDFTLPASGRARIGVYDVHGRRLAVLADAEFPAGLQRLRWNLRSEKGARVPAGLYFFRMDSDGGRRAQRFLVIR